MRELFYIANYTSEEIINRGPVRNFASNAKINYIIRGLLEKKSITLVSTGLGSEVGYFSKCITEKKNLKSVYLPTIRFFNSAKALKLSSIVFANIYLFLWILKNIKKEDQVILYSTPWLNLTIVLARLIKGFKLCLELEEIYYTNEELHPLKRAIYCFIETLSIKSADDYIIVSSYLAEMLNMSNYIICLGDYSIPKTYDFYKKKKPTILYSGSIDYERGVFTLLEAIPYLKNQNLKLIISGLGPRPKIIELLNIIDKLKEKGFDVAYVGALEEEDYKALLSSSDICISPQIVDNSFSNTSFPSKIIKYLSYGKTVISSKMATVVNSEAANYLVFYEEGSPEALASKIDYQIQTYFNKSEAELLKQIRERMEFICGLDNKFKQALNKFIL